MSKKKASVTNPKLAQLLDLIKENPHLPVVPMVDREVVADDTWGYWLGSWGIASIERICHGEERYFFYDEHDMEDLVTEKKGWDWYDKATDDEVLEAYRSLPWIKCIVVYIELPEE